MKKTEFEEFEEFEEDENIFQIFEDIQRQKAAKNKIIYGIIGIITSLFLGWGFYMIPNSKLEKHKINIKIFLFSIPSLIFVGSASLLTLGILNQNNENFGRNNK